MIVNPDGSAPELHTHEPIGEKELPFKFNSLYGDTSDPDKVGSLCSSLNGVAFATSWSATSMWALLTNAAKRGGIFLIHQKGDSRGAAY